MAFTILTISGCKKNDDADVDKYVGTYKVKITPNFNLTYPGYGSYSLTSESAIETDCVITNFNENVTVKIEGVNGFINDIVITGYCNGLGMNLDDCTYDGHIRFDDNNYVECDITLDNPRVSSPYNGTMSWESSVTGTCNVDIFGLGQNTQCDVSGNISFVADKK